ncbi:hypothetical protein BH24ACI5_BH24ACI5_02810 [soil metagenome]
MRIIRLHLVLACILLAGLAVPLSISAQPPTSPPSRPEATPQPPAPLERDVDADDDGRRFRFRRPIVRVAQNYTLAAGDVVREVRSVFGDVVIEGRVEQDVVVIMGSARLAGTAVVQGSLVVIGGSATIEPNAVIRDDLALFGGTLTAPASFSPEGQHIVIGSPWIGETLEDVAPWITRGLLWGRLIVPDLDWIWGVVGVFFLLYLVLNTVFDRPVGASADALVQRPLSVFMVGLLVLLLTGPVAAIVAASVVGLAVVPFILCAVIVMGLVGKTAVARAIGRSVLRGESPDGRIQAMAAFVIGFGLLTLAYMVPVLGFVTWALTTVFGLGAATVTFRALLRRERPAPVPAAVPAAAPALTAPVPDTAPPTATPSVMPDPAPATVEIPPPPPLYSAGLARYPRAGFLDRLAAFTLDCILVAIANAMLDMSRYEGFFFLLLLTYHIAFWAWRGTTLGGIICNLRVIRTHGAELRPADAVVRGLSSVFSIAALGIGCLWMLQDAERQMWHDKIAGTLVVKVPRDLVLP